MALAAAATRPQKGDKDANCVVPEARGILLWGVS